MFEKIPVDDILVYGDNWAFCHIPKNGGANFKIRYRQHHKILTTGSIDPLMISSMTADDPGADYFNRTAPFFHQPPTWYQENYPKIRGKQWLCMTRNPYERYVSWFFFLQRKQQLDNMEFEEFVKKEFLRTNPLTQSVRTINGIDHLIIWRRWWTQSQWIENMPNMKVFSLEKPKKLESYIRTEFSDTSYNNTQHRPWEEYYTSELKSIVYDRYEEDFIKLGYKY